MGAGHELNAARNMKLSQDVCHVKARSTGAHANSAGYFLVSLSRQYQLVHFSLPRAQLGNRPVLSTNASLAGHCTQWDIHLTQISSTCSMAGCGGLPAYPGRIGKLASARSRPVGSICSGCGGRKGCGTRGAGNQELGRCDRFCGSVPVAATRSRSRPARFSRTRAPRGRFGFGPCGGSPARRTASAPWDGSGSWDGGASRRPGPGCINCGGPG